MWDEGRRDYVYSAGYVVGYFVAVACLYVGVYRPLATMWGSTLLAGVVVYAVLPVGCMGCWSAYYGERNTLVRDARRVTLSVLIAVFLYLVAVGVLGGEISTRIFEVYDPRIAGVIGLVWLFCVFVMWGASETPVGDSTEEHVRGRELVTYSRAEELAAAGRRKGDRGVFWGGLWLPSEVATSHFCVVGATGSGKTLSLRLLMQSVLPEIAKGGDARAVVYDAKMDLLPYLRGMGIPEELIVTLNPFDRRGVAWDLAADITSPVSALQLATILIPDEKRTTQPFFPNAARELLTAVVMSFIRTMPGKWEFRDVILAASSKENIKQVINLTPETRDVLQHFENDQTASNILSTLREKLHRYRFIAAAWSKAGRKISLKEWVTSNAILVLGNDEATRTALDAVNQLIFKRIGELVLAQSESSNRRTWIFLDEVREAGKLEGLASLATKGRSKGACLVLGLQDIEGLVEVYGQNVAQEILGQCSNKAILRLENPGTAEWAARLFGRREVLEMRKSTTEGRSGRVVEPGSSSTSSGSSTTQQIIERSLVLASQFSDVPVTTPANGLTGYYVIPSIGAYRARLSGDWLARQLIESDKEIIAVDWRPEEDQYLKPWGSDELVDRGLELKGSNEVTNPDNREEQAALGVEITGDGMRLLENVGE